MEIIYDCYTAKEVNGRFDLYKTVKVVAQKETKNHKIGDEYERTIEIGYGYTFERLLRRMAEDIISREDKLEIREYIARFREILGEIGVLENAV